MKTTLIAVSGMSPAILTETLWALAQERPATVPDEVLVITTAKGAADIQRDLLTPNPVWGGKSVWETLRGDIFSLTKQPKKSPKLQISVRVIDLPDPATGLRTPAVDLRTRQHNDEAADFIIRAIAPFCDADDQHVIASIAGGRKTMGALLYAGMSLLAKETDRVTHVLVTEPFETVRGFFYPAQPAQNLKLDPRRDDSPTVEACAASIELADIPFVPLRNKFAELNEPRRTFAGLVESYSRGQRPLPGPPTVTLDAECGVLTLLGKDIHLSGRALIVTDWLYQRAKAGHAHFPDLGSAGEECGGIGEAWRQRFPNHRHTARSSGCRLEKEDLTKALNELRDKLRKHGAGAAIPYLAPERDRVGFEIAPG